MIIRKTLKLTKEDYYTKHLAIINPLLPQHLTPREIEVLACFMSLNGSIDADRFGTTGRKIVMDRVGLTLSGLSNHLKSLKAKGFVRDTVITPILFPKEDSQEYQFKLTNVDASYGKS